MAVAITESSSVCFTSLPPLWHRKAPRQLTEGCPADDPIAGWRVWKKYLASRTRPRSTPFLAGREPPLLWGWPDVWQRETVRAATKSPSSLAEIVLADDGVAAPDLPLALQMVGLAYALPALADELPAETWWHLAERLHDVAIQAGQHRVDWPADPRDVVRQQLLAGELSLALRYLFPEVRVLRALQNGGRAALSEALIEVTDGRGLPHARLLPVLAPLFACWTRTRWLGARLRRGAWSPKAEYQYQWLVRHAIRLADAEGNFLLSATDANRQSRTEPVSKSANMKLFAMALDLVGDRGDFAAASAALPRVVMPKHLSPDPASFPVPSLNSDWSGIAVLSNGWSPADMRLAIAYADDPVRIELLVGGERIFAGPWTGHTTRDGSPVQIVGEWEMLCWEKNKRLDFLELGVQLSEGLRLERQFVFGRQDQVLYVADIVTANHGEPRHMQHSLSLALGHDAHWRPEADTRDGLIVGRKLRAAVLPLSLHEWRCDPRGGSLSEQDGCLVLTQEAHGRALYCPLLFDLDRKRAKRQRTWRQLTVGEAMEAVPRDVAVGYRAQSGRDQWLFYRSLGPAGNRTFLGQNVAGEFCAGRFLANGKFKEWIEIETC